MDIEGEIRDLKRRVGDLEGAVNVLTGHMRSVHPEILALQQLSVKRFDSLDSAMSRFVARLDTVSTQLWSLRDDFPVLVDDAVRKTLSGKGN